MGDELSRPGAPRILLVRHGRSSHVHDGRWVTAVDVRRYEDAYDAAGIRDDPPPSALTAVAAGAQIIAASDLPRAIASARRIAPDRDLAISPLLREIKIEPPRWIPIRLPIEVWDAMCHLQWSYRLLRRADHEFVRRATDAAEWLMERAGTSATVVAVTHAGFRRIVADRLLSRGWQAAPGPRGYANWSIWSYSLPT